jgi:GMP synthase (glutamine-hydrolysing)
VIVVLRHVAHEHLGTIAEAFRRKKRAFRYIDVWKTGVVFPDPADVEALVIMGGPMGVYERKKYPFLTPELKFIKTFLATGRPALGVCLGSQLLAAALGGTVMKNKAKEIGWFPLDLTAVGQKDARLSEFPPTSVVFQWHGDTFTLPSKATLLARSPLCRRQAFRFRDNVYALQFHLEVTPTMIREWARQPGAEEEMSAVGPDVEIALKKGITAHAAALRLRARRFFDEWVRLIPSL